MEDPTKMDDEWGNTPISGNPHINPRRSICQILLKLFKSSDKQKKVVICGDVLFFHLVYILALGGLVL